MSFCNNLVPDNGSNNGTNNGPYNAVIKLRVDNSLFVVPNNVSGGQINLSCHIPKVISECYVSLGSKIVITRSHDGSFNIAKAKKILSWEHGLKIITAGNESDIHRYCISSRSVSNSSFDEIVCIDYKSEYVIGSRSNVLCYSKFDVIT